MIRNVYFNFNQTRLALKTPYCRDSALEGIKFSALKGDENFELTVDMPETLQKQLNELKERRGESTEQTLIHALRILKTFKHFQQEDRTARLVMLKSYSTGKIFKKIHYQSVEVPIQSPAYSIEPTRSYLFRLDVDNLVALRALARQYNRTLEQLPQDAIHMLYQIEAIKRTYPDLQLGILTFNGGDVDGSYTFNL